MGLEVKNFTETDCVLFLKKYFSGQNCELVNFTTGRSSNDRNGFLGDHLILKITVSVDNEEKDLRFFIKKLPRMHEVSIQFIEAGNIFNKEIKTYEFLEQVKTEFPNFDRDICPLYYFSADNSFIIMEELQVQGYFLCRNLKFEHVQLAVQAVAKFHSGTLIFEEMKSKQLKRPYRISEDYSEWLKEAVFVDDKNHIAHKFTMCGINSLFALVDFVPENEITTDEFKAKLRRTTEEMFEIFRPSKRFRNVWCNGNLWGNNIMYKCENEHPVKCKIFDFQLARYNPPAADLCELLYEIVDKNDRQHHFQHYLNLYYETLKSEIEKNGFDMDTILTRDDFDVSCKIYLPYVMLFKSTFFTYYSVDKSLLNEIHTNSELYTKLTFGDRSEFLVNVMESDERFRNHVIEVLEDLRDQLSYDCLNSVDCYQIVNEKFGTTQYKMLNFSLGKNDNFQQRNLNIEVSLNEEVRSLNFLIKLFPKQVQQTDANTEGKLFTKEIKIYTKIFPCMIQNNVNVIKECYGQCYLALSEELMVFDDFKKNNSNGFSFVSIYDYETILCVVKKLAKFHASSMILENSCNFKLNSVFQDEMEETTYNGKNKMTTVVEEILDQISLIDKFDFGLQNHIIEAFSKLEMNVSPSEKYRNVLCHGNLSPKTILIKSEEDTPIDCIFVDFDSYRYNTPAHDLISFLHQATDREFRTNFQSNILNAYYMEISAILNSYNIPSKSVFTYQEFISSCDAVKEFAVANCIIQLYSEFKIEDESLNLNFIVNQDKSNKNERSSLFKKIVECLEEFQ